MVPLEASALVRAGQSLASIPFACFGCAALDFLLLSLAVAGDEDLASAWLIFRAGEGRVANILQVLVAANLLLFRAKLLAVASGVLALARTMTALLAQMRSTTQLLLAHQTTRHILQEARLILQCLLTTHASFLNQEGALRARFVVLVAAVRYLSMSAFFGSIACLTAWWWLCTARQRRVKYCPTAMA